MTDFQVSALYNMSFDKCLYSSSRIRQGNDNKTTKKLTMSPKFLCLAIEMKEYP